MFVFDRYTHPHLHVYWADCGMFDPDLHQFVYRIRRGSLELQEESKQACLDATQKLLFTIAGSPHGADTLMGVMPYIGGRLFSLMQKGGVGCLIREAERERDEVMQPAQDMLVSFFQQAGGAPEFPAWYDDAREYARRTPGGGLYIPGPLMTDAFLPSSDYTDRQILLINRDGTMSVWEGRDARSPGDMKLMMTDIRNPFSNLYHIMHFYYNTEMPLIYEYSGGFVVDTELAMHALIMEGDIRRRQSCVR